MAKVIEGLVLETWEQTQARAQAILSRALGMVVTVDDGAVVYINWDTPAEEEVGMLIFVSEEKWVYRPKSEYK